VSVRTLGARDGCLLTLWNAIHRESVCARFEDTTALGLGLLGCYTVRQVL
jgi:hypothetical protein